MQPEEFYRPPQADLEIYTPQPTQTQAQTLAPFFQTPPWKMALLSVMSLGLYQLFWFHSHWTRRKTHGEKVSPLARSIFGAFFAYSLFDGVNRQIQQSAPPGLPLSAGAPLQPLSAGLLALGYFALSLLWRLPENLGLFAGLLSILPLIAAQRRINELHAALGYDPQEGSRLSGGDVAVLVLGGIFWLLILASLFMPAQG
jgi:hypothetical protein